MQVAISLPSKGCDAVPTMTEPQPHSEAGHRGVLAPPSLRWVPVDTEEMAPGFGSCDNVLSTPSLLFLIPPQPCPHCLSMEASAPSSAMHHTEAPQFCPCLQAQGASPGQLSCAHGNHGCGHQCTLPCPSPDAPSWQGMWHRSAWPPLSQARCMLGTEHCGSWHPNPHPLLFRCPGALPGLHCLTSTCTHEAAT